MDASKEMITNKIFFLYSIHLFDQRMFYYFVIFHKKDSKNKNLVIRKWETNWIYCGANCLDAICLKLWNGTMNDHKMRMQCMVVPRWTLIHNICQMKCMFMPKEAFFPFYYNVVIVMNLLLYTRKCEGKWGK